MASSAAAALLIDYTLTVAVSIAAGVSAITSAVPALHVNRVVLSLAFIAMLMLGNLRGLRESTKLFGVPVYAFVGVMLALVIAGAYQVVMGTAVPVATADPLPTLGAGSITLFVLLSAFANGCTAMTGVEAVSDGVPAFKAPAAQTAIRTLGLMAVLAITMFTGISYLAHAYQVVPSETETVVSQIARGVLGGRNFLYYTVQAATMLILVLAANTAFADFPRLASIVAAGFLCIIFGGDPHALIPLYMIGVFLSFTLSQTGMFLRARRMREAGWRTASTISGVGGVVTFCVLIVVAVTKGLDGAWIVVVLIPFLAMIFRATRSHYDNVASQLSLTGVEVDTTPHGHIVIVPIGGVHRAVIEALRYASSLAKDVRAVYVNVNPECWLHSSATGRSGAHT